MATIGAIQSYREEKRRERENRENRFHAMINPAPRPYLPPEPVVAVPEVAQAAPVVHTDVQEPFYVEPNAPFVVNLKPEELDENKEISL